MDSATQLMHSWPAPAKVNLFLHVTGRRQDGYHLLQTAFQFLDYADELSFRVTTDGRISRAEPLVGVSEDADLTLRAAHLLQEVARVRRGVAIRVKKHIPIGGGLGGGSSDAATTLLALNRLWDLRLGRSQLARLALQLGADVPVFVGGRAAWAEGVGEQLTPLEPEEAWYLVAVPPVHVSTALVFGELGLTAFSAPITIRDFHAGRIHNDLEQVVRRHYPEVDAAFAWLARFGQPRMTGSGGCVYLTITDAETGKRILAQLPQGLGGFVARGVNRHPLLEM